MGANQSFRLRLVVARGPSLPKSYAERLEQLDGLVDSDLLTNDLPEFQIEKPIVWLDSLERAEQYLAQVLWRESV